MRSEYKAIFIFVIIFSSLFIYTGCGANDFGNTSSDNVFRLLCASENRDLEKQLMDYAKKENIPLQITYAGTIEIMDLLNENQRNYDAAWISNSVWLYMLNSNVKITNSKPTSINPIAFGIKKSKAKELGFDSRTVSTLDIVQTVNDGRLKFVMPSATQTNSGASAYLGFLTGLSNQINNTEGILTLDDLDNPLLKDSLTAMFKGVTRSSGSDEFIGDMFIDGNYDALVNYEASIININLQLIKEGKEELFLVYPYDGVSLSDSPFAYVDNGKKEKEAQFKLLQSYLLSSNTQKLLADTGRRSGYGGLVPYASEDIFNKSWGIDLSKNLISINYPSTEVIKKALSLYQSELRKPSATVFCLDYSGSMHGEGNASLIRAMEYILSEQTASNDFIQFSEKDQIFVIPFSSEPIDLWYSANGVKTDELLANIKSLEPFGGTNIFDTAILALEQLEQIDPDEYTRSVILMTDGKSNRSNYYNLQDFYDRMEDPIPIFSITFGDADTNELEPISKLTNSLIMDGYTNLVGAFKKVRGYN